GSFRRFQPEDPARGALGRDGPEWRRQDDAAEDDRWNAPAGCRRGGAWSEPEDGLLRAAGAGPAEPGHHRVRAAAARLPARVDWGAAQPAGRISVLGRRDRQEDTR